jgi:hypothetical protein
VGKVVFGAPAEQLDAAEEEDEDDLELAAYLA